MKHKRFSARERGEVNLLVVALGVMVAFVLVFAGLFISSYMKERAATKNLNIKTAAAYAQGKDAGAKAQKAADEASARVAAETPYDTYTAPSAFGDFVIKYPKDWSSWVKEVAGGSTQVEFIATPDIVKVLPDNSINYAQHITLVNNTYENVKVSYDQRIKAKKVTAASATVSGISGTRYTGDYDTRHTGIVVLVPVRDKTMVFTCENTRYQSEFEATLKQSTIRP